MSSGWLHHQLKTNSKEICIVYLALRPCTRQQAQASLAHRSGASWGISRTHDRMRSSAVSSGFVLRRDDGAFPSCRPTPIETEGFNLAENCSCRLIESSVSRRVVAGRPVAASAWETTEGKKGCSQLLIWSCIHVLDSYSLTPRLVA
jgi:hypothetical protein